MPGEGLPGGLKGALAWEEDKLAPHPHCYILTHLPSSAAHTSHTSNYQPWESWENNNVLQCATRKRHHDVLRSSRNIRRARNQIKEHRTKSAAVEGRGGEGRGDSAASLCNEYGEDM